MLHFSLLPLNKLMQVWTQHHCHVTDWMHCGCLGSMTTFSYLCTW